MVQSVLLLFFIIVDTKDGSRILVRGAQRSFDPRGDPEPKICLKMPENCMILKKSQGRPASPQGPLDPL